MSLPLPTFTTDDLRAFPDDGQRYELLEGMLLVTPAPGSAHQVVLGRLLVALHPVLDAEHKAHVVSPGEIEIALHRRGVGRGAPGESFRHSV